MTSDPNAPERQGWWKRPFFLFTSPIVLGLLVWISTATDIFQVTRSTEASAERGRSSQDTVIVASPMTAPSSSAEAPPVSLAPTLQTPAPQAPAPQTEAARRVVPDVVARAEEADTRAAIVPRTRENRPPAASTSATNELPEWFEEAKDAVPEKRPTMVHRLAMTSAQRSCVPRISAHYGVAGGFVSDALTRAGNPNCVQATYGDRMSLTVQPCGGELTEISQIQVTRGAFLEDGRPRTYAASMSYQLIAGGQETLPAPLGTGGYARVQTAEFSPVRVSAVRVTLRSPQTRGYKVYQRICSIVVR